MATKQLKVGDIVTVEATPEFLEAVFVDNMMDIGASRCDAIIGKLEDKSRRWKITELQGGTPGDPDDPETAAICGVGFRCSVPSMIETSSLTKVTK